MGMSLFFANKSYYPSLQVQTTCEITFSLAKTFVANLKNTYLKLKQAIAIAQLRY